jgi:hypothetical protein
MGSRIQRGGLGVFLEGNFEPLAIDAEKTKEA